MVKVNRKNSCRTWKIRMYRNSSCSECYLRIQMKHKKKLLITFKQKKTIQQVGGRGGEGRSLAIAWPYVRTYGYSKIIQSHMLSCGARNKKKKSSNKRHAPCEIVRLQAFSEAIFDCWFTHRRICIVYIRIEIPEWLHFLFMRHNPRMILFSSWISESCRTLYIIDSIILFSG